LILYLDTSAMLKLYVSEPGAEQLRKAVAAAALVCTHLITYAEMRSAFARALRMGRITASALKRYRGELDRDWSTLNVVAVDEGLMHRASDLLDRFPLRAFDGVQLAAAESLFVVRQRDQLCFASFDNRLNQAAAELGLRLLE
jgi:predicted nucleic acid-binding protein